jgi:hypothetical protein
MNALPLFSLFAFIVMLVLLPILFGELLATSCRECHLRPRWHFAHQLVLSFGRARRLFDLDQAFFQQNGFFL